MQSTWYRLGEAPRLCRSSEAKENGDVFGLIGGNSDDPREEVPIAKLQRTEEDTGNQP
jgi:hypothetical protein